LIVVTNALVSKPIIEGDLVKGVEILSKREAEQIKKVYAAKEVILTAGCFQSPQLLLLSGIGPKQA
jgi:choline dehydrogenase-like flavoprotein